MESGGAVRYVTEPKALSAVLRELGPALGVNVALMHGVHEREVGPYDFEEAAPETILAVLCEDAGLTRFTSPAYAFLAPAEYAGLNRLNLRAMAPELPPLPEGSVAIGADTPLFDALALLGEAFDATFVADNAVAAARTGELSLPEVSGLDALEAVMKSARLDASAFRVETGDGYVLFYARGNPPRNEVVLNRETLTDRQRTMLARRVDVQLPWREPEAGTVGAFASAATLGRVLPELTAQLGVRVTADEDIYRFPVNPCTMNRVSVDTVLKLLINQWLSQAFAVEVRADSLHIRPAP